MRIYILLRFLIYGNCNDFLNILQDILLGKVKKYRLLYRKRLQNSTRTYYYVAISKEKIVIQMFRKKY